jgi:hypothetical protein
VLGQEVKGGSPYLPTIPVLAGFSLEFGSFPGLLGMPEIVTATFVAQIFQLLKKHCELAKHVA